MCGRKSSEIPLDTRRAIIKLSQARNSQMKISRDLAISCTTIQSIIYKFQQTNSVENTGHRGRKSKWTIRDTNLLLPDLIYFTSAIYLSKKSPLGDPLSCLFTFTLYQLQMVLTYLTIVFLECKRLSKTWKLKFGGGC